MSRTEYYPGLASSTSVERDSSNAFWEVRGRVKTISKIVLMEEEEEEEEEEDHDDEVDEAAFKISFAITSSERRKVMKIFAAAIWMKALVEQLATIIKTRFL